MTEKIYVLISMKQEIQAEMSDGQSILELLSVNGKDITFAGLFFGLLFFSFRAFKWWFNNHTKTHEEIVSSLKKENDKLEEKLEVLQSKYEKSIQTQSDIVKQCYEERINLLKRLSDDEDKMIEVLSMALKSQ